MTILPYICNCIAGFIYNGLKTFKLQMVVQAPTSAIASSNYYLGPLDQIPSVWGLGEYVASTIQGQCPSTAGSSYRMKKMSLSLGNVILLKEKGGEWESQFLSRLIRSPESPRRGKGSGAPKEEKGVRGSQGRERKIIFFFLHCFVLVNITMYLARGYVSP